MQIAIVKRQPKRRCRIPRRPHANLDYFFGRYETTGRKTNDHVRPEVIELDHPFQSQHRH